MFLFFHGFGLRVVWWGFVFARLVWSYLFARLRRSGTWRLGFAFVFLMEGETATMEEEVGVLLAKLKFSKEEAKTIVSQSKMETILQGWEAWQ